MENTIEKWLQYDPRHVKPNRGHAMYPLTTDIILSRMKSQLPLKFIADKKILDLGCSIPFNELWCKEHGANLYHGVEFFKTIARVGDNLVTRPNKIVHNTIEKFVNSIDLSVYDTILLQSSLNTVRNFIDVFEKICLSKADIVFESTKIRNNDDALIKLSPLGAHNTDKQQECVSVQNFYPNVQAIEILFESYGYSVSHAPNKIMEAKLPSWSRYKYCCWGMYQGTKKYQYLTDIK